jgi:antitoxin component of MazEF toxin-antitoxin module
MSNQTVKLRTLGRCYVVTVPKAMVRELDWNQGDNIEVKLDGSVLTIRALTKRKRGAR